jgi:hypothetical protein
MLLATTLAMPAALAKNSTSSTGQTSAPGQTAVDRVEKRIADLHAKLQITPAEQPLWDKFAQIMRENAQRISQSASERAAKLKDMTASDNMQSYAQLAMLHAQDVENLSAAFLPLYASFSPDQQHNADALFRNVSTSRAARHRH